jgi:cobalt-zinc-cadmium efflux system protein
MAHDHHHPAPAAGRAGARHQRALATAFVLVVAFLGVQVGVGVTTGSLALLSDAGHMATDAIGLGVALLAIRIATHREPTRQQTFGLYRLEILAALFNSILLFGVAGYVLYEGIDRLRDPEHVASVPVLVVGVIGLLVNVVSFRLLREGASESLNVEGAYLEVMADMVGSIGVIVGATVLWITGWTWVDPVVGIAIGVFVLPRAWRLGREALRVILQAAPDDIDLDEVASELAAIEGVVGVHDLHVWTLTSDMEVLTAHLMTDGTADGHAVLDQARALLADRHGIDHATLQVEPDTHVGCEELTW